MRQPEKEMTEHIFAAVDRLMAKEGLNNLSMSKLAKEADVSAGTIYLYFKNKDELLEQFARKVFHRFAVAMEKDFDETETFFEQYQRMWRNLWNLMQQNPTLLTNLYQYESLPKFTEFHQEFDNGHWAMFCKKAQQAGVICDLPHYVLFALGLETAVNIVHKSNVFRLPINDDILQQVIERSWRSIQN